MLVLTRKINECINIGNEIEIFIVEIKDDHVKIGIKAPKNVPIYRQEIYQAILDENKLAATSQTSVEDIDDFLPEKAAEQV
jgi:carbon storage regulator